LREGERSRERGVREKRERETRERESVNNGLNLFYICLNVLNSVCMYFELPD